MIPPFLNVHVGRWFGFLASGDSEGLWALWIFSLLQFRQLLPQLNFSHSMIFHGLFGLQHFVLNSWTVESSWSTGLLAETSIPKGNSEASIVYIVPWEISTHDSWLRRGGWGGQQRPLGHIKTPSMYCMPGCDLWARTLCTYVRVHEKTTRWKVEVG